MNMIILQEMDNAFNVFIRRVDLTDNRKPDIKAGTIIAEFL